MYPNIRAKTTEAPVTTHAIRLAANSARNKSSIDIFSSVILKSLFVLYQYGNRKTIVTLSVHEVHGRYRPNYWTV